MSPTDARSINLYEVNPLTIEATGSTFQERSTFEDFYDAPNARPVPVTISASTSTTSTILAPTGFGYSRFTPMELSVGKSIPTRINLISREVPTPSRISLT